MSVEHPSARIPDAPPPSFDERWAAWRAKGDAHDRVMRRKLAIAAPFAGIAAAALLYAMANL